MKERSVFRIESYFSYFAKEKQLIFLRNYTASRVN